MPLFLLVAGLLVGHLTLSAWNEAAHRASLDAYQAWAETAESRELLDCLTEPMTAHILGRTVRWCDPERVEALHALRRDVTRPGPLDIISRL